MTDLVARYGLARVPRYTSYPTAPHFDSRIGPAAHRDWLGALDAGTRVSLYLHVPFCARLCWYCGCHTTITRDPERVHRYADLLARELDLVRAALPARLAAGHVHWGGGTPTMLGAGGFTRIAALIRDRFALTADAEIAIEIDPRSLDAETARALAGAGVTRASLGVQDFTARVQQAVNRVQPFEQVARAAACLRAHGIRALNFDLMYGLPHQTADDVARSVDLAVRLAPDRVAVFGYAHVPWLKRHQRLLDEAALPGAAARRVQAKTAAARLIAHGYVAIGLDHFARPGDALARAAAEGRLRRNFQGYTTDDAPALIGLGASAISTLPQGYAQNAGDLRQYRGRIAAGRLATARGVALDDDDRIRRRIIARLMCGFEADLGPADGTLEVDRGTLAEMARDGLVVGDGSRLRVTEAGRPYVRTVAACFDRYLSSRAGRHTQAV